MVNIKDRSQLLTEQRNPRTTDIDCKTTLEIIDIINAEDAKVFTAIHRERKHIAKAADLIVDAFKAGGRLIYVGSGTSGRLGILDAAECPPTFGTNPHMITGIIAGGEKAVFQSIEGAEDLPEDGAHDIQRKEVNHRDVVVGITTGGTTPYVMGALFEAKKRNAKTIFLCCNPETTPNFDIDVIIRPIAGPEVIAGSTRMKAGTVTKLILNMLTTTAMIKMGKVYENLMIDLRVLNAKLADRAERIIMTVTGIGREDAKKLLEAAFGNVKVALVMQKLTLDYAEAKKRLDAQDGFVRKVLEKY
ncbi:MAG: N-acetylmuramic acid 6-phosphate etherase [Candidatus Jettenia sp.]|uniref:N-acetylmuramic acid 6-phosphate etherase n=1 Tax=Candidatus Jettenia caeni TaxID=247490 RepID=I3IQ53_9BACT|nr:N-acetylmuramic acid 6-phosphate etherase [Candidatus Jettenia sp. AMX1]MBC6929524.1 N-acetylmuramic acid 6-phosphate etherase [Candidatus Jettenia sp.]NUN22483.1 N-acetylmuramic acid 6-phosphate etherase [Candidatus Jettenia caeni]KAA0247687.1 MAG: N-acetylmuramic acid 6-phosphate etherase [Candidatus Jettenia sp. AMX1]MCE7881147.1 N-acetylmuramic acid 6-phosphate etherase [Candidatus Jettenia sp. AMX1]MCQ3927887.1 N-acetylmuramic acid 6-phosphate etherase [Candidatus Jettenia sp.]